MPYLSLLVPVFAGLLFLQTYSFDFAYDDVLQIVYNPLVADSPSGVRNYLALFSNPTPPGNLYRPLTLLSYKVQVDLFGLSAWHLHLVNILLYALTCTLVWRLYDQLLESETFAVLGALLFVAHPTHVEVVANIIGRAELMAAIFGLMSCFLLKDALINISKRKTFIFSSLLSAVCLLLAALSKESALVFIIIAPLTAYVLTSKYENLSLSDLKLPALCLSLASVFALLLRHLALGQSFVLKSDGSTIYAENPIFHLSFSERLLPAIKILGDYFLLLLAPLKLSADYSMMPAEILRQTFGIEGLLAYVILAVLLLCMLIIQSSSARLLIFWSFVAFALTANIITPIGTIMGERLAFVPGIGFIGFVAFVLQELSFRKKRLASLLSVGALGFFSYQSILRVPVWQNNEVLFAQTLIDAPGSPKAKYNYAVLRFTEHQDAEGAKKYLKEALQIHPDHIFSLKLMADIAIKQQNYAALEFYLKRVLKLQPNDREVKDRLDTLLDYKLKLEKELKAKSSSPSKSPTKTESKDLVAEAKT